MSTTSQRLIASIEAHTGLPEEQLARTLLLRANLDTTTDRGAVALTVAIQLWLEAKAGDDDLSASQMREATRRAAREYGWSDPQFPELAEPLSEALPASATHAAPAKRRERGASAAWPKARAELAALGVPDHVLAKVELFRPTSAAHLREMMLNHQTRLHIKRPELRDLFRVLGITRSAMRAHASPAEQERYKKRKRNQRARRKAAEANGGVVPGSKAERRAKDRVLQQAAAERKAEALRNYKDPFVL